MATQHRHQLSRLNIPPSLNTQQPGMGFDGGQPMYSPALPTALQHSFQPPFPMNGLGFQTPMQPYFHAQPPGAPGRPNFTMQHKGQPSIVHLMHQPGQMPMTPLMGHNGFPQPPMMLPQGQPYGQQFPNRNRRQQSVSLGGPPKAPLGGPGRKHSPLPPTAVNTPPPPPAAKGKKITVNFPQETVPGEEGQPSTRAPWARTPLDPSSLPAVADARPPEVSTAEPYPSDAWRLHVPDTVDVFLPGKRVIEEKLQRLGVERGPGTNVPHIHAPHARAASISSPADPALLYFKLNKLQQQSQTNTGTQSLSTSPQPPFTFTPSPSGGMHAPPRFQRGHGHSLSLAQSNTFMPSTSFNPTAPYNPFGADSTLGSDQIIHRSSPGIGPMSASSDNIHAPQGRVPVTVSGLAAPNAPGRPDSKPDFTLGFGVGIPEAEEETEEEPVDRDATEMADESFATEYADGDVSREDNEEGEEEDASTVAQSRLHSRHVSRLSAALSLRSVGGAAGQVAHVGPDTIHERSDVRGTDDPDQDAVGEWTGSEDMRATEELSEDESIGEWSNPSDEERARQQRVERRMRRRTQQEIQKPRRLPNFPRPPDNTFAIPLRRDEEMVSNPSEEGHAQYLGIDSGNYPLTSPGSGRPLPPLPHSRTASGQLSSHDPALAHSRTASDMPSAPPAQTEFANKMPRRNSLNPFAQPFVFGARPSGSFTPGTFGQSATPPQLGSSGHSRAPSFGKPLNVAAPEFKPGGLTGFTFRPPPGVPQMVIPPVDPIPRPLPVPPEAMSIRPEQGREKRQRRASSASVNDVEDEGERSMNSFRFPAPSESPQQQVSRRSAPSTPRLSGSRRQSSLNAQAQPFTFSGFSTLPFIQKETEPLPHSLIANVGSPEQFLEDESTARDQEMQISPKEDMVMHGTSRLKRAPIPLDFKHPVSKNTVPASVFRALINGNGDERTRRTVRSRLGSREIFDHMHRPSLDDLAVPAISHKASRGRLVTDPGLHPPLQSPDDLFSPQRRSSLPGALHSANSSGSMPATNLTRHLELQHFEDRLEDLLDEKIELIRHDLQRSHDVSGAPAISSSTEAMITEVVSLFRAQLQESAARGLDDSQMDARGEMDFELIKDVVQQGQAESRALLQRDLNDLAQRLDMQARAAGTANDFAPFVEQLSNRTINAVMNAMSQIGMRLESIEKAPSLDRGALIHELTTVLAPVLNSLRPDPVDYGVLTDQLTQAVKPHISQLIDLASDKRETAGLIVDRLIPLLPPLRSATPSLDTNAIIAQLTGEVRKIIAPIDAFEIKEQVADLVVERLDSRLAVRDRAFSTDTLSGKVNESVGQLLQPIQQVAATIDSLAAGQRALHTDNAGLASIHKDVMAIVSDLPVQLKKATDALTTVQLELRSRPESTGLLDKPVRSIESTVLSLASGQQTISQQNQESLSIQHEVLDRLNALPENLAVATNVLQAAHAELLSSRDSSRVDVEEMRRLKATNAELQVQLAKARGAHGQVRVEKDNYYEKLRGLETDRERLRAQFDEVKAEAVSKAAESAARQARNSELEEALSQALARLKASDVTAQTTQERIAALEKSNREVEADRQSLRSKVDALELKVNFSNREKESALQALAALQKEHDHLASQQSHWDDLRQASEKIEMLTTLIGEADNEEIRELKRTRDQHRALQNEHAALQRRYKEQDTKVANTERAAANARQTLGQAQQRASEWEKRAKDYESKLELVSTKLDQADQTHAQLDADYSLAKLQLEEKEADDRLAKDRENKLRERVSALESQIKSLQAEAEQAKKAAAAAAIPSTPPPYRNGYARAPARPDSRASTIYPDSRAGTPVAHLNGLSRVTSNASTFRSITPDKATASVWDSMHAPNKPAAPKQYPHLGPSTPKARRPQQPYRPSIPPSVPSPALSTVSLTPTQGDDGWWS
ncbi:hypothetical protein PLICRDRAFT_114601 [Plicaturopsis crispa FD-325 SS-3]|nr:hypothetical protein PLICRDRAFT_114601 [Plicaturopsis crispa FD-325 SS-3]